MRIATIFAAFAIVPSFVAAQLDSVSSWQSSTGALTGSWRVRFKEHAPALVTPGRNDAYQLWAVVVRLRSNLCTPTDEKIKLWSMTPLVGVAGRIDQRPISNPRRTRTFSPQWSEESRVCADGHRDLSVNNNVSASWQAGSALGLLSCNVPRLGGSGTYAGRSCAADGYDGWLEVKVKATWIAGTANLVPADIEVIPYWGKKLMLTERPPHP